MAVDVNRSLNAGMSQPGRDDVDRHPRGQQDRCVGVPQVVEANALNPAALQYLVERSSQHIGKDNTAILTGVNMGPPQLYVLTDDSSVVS